MTAGRCADWPEALRIKGSEEASNAYSVIAPLRVLLLQRSGGDGWVRSDQLMDHLDDRQTCDDDWEWYDRYIVDFIRNHLGMADVFTEDQVCTGQPISSDTLVRLTLILSFPPSASSTWADGEPA